MEGEDRRVGKPGSTAIGCRRPPQAGGLPGFSAAVQDAGLAEL
jgi:hypothetical protein